MTRSISAAALCARLVLGNLYVTYAAMPDWDGVEPLEQPKPARDSAAAPKASDNPAARTPATDSSGRAAPKARDNLPGPTHGTDSSMRIGAADSLGRTRSSGTDSAARTADSVFFDSSARDNARDAWRHRLDNEMRAEAEGAPTLALLPTAAPAGTPGGRNARQAVECALRLGLTESGAFRVWTAEETARGNSGNPLPNDCFSSRCMTAAAQTLSSAKILVSQYSVRDTLTFIRMVLAEVPEGRIRKAAQVWGKPGKGGILAFAREAAERFAAAGGPEAYVPRPEDSGQVTDMLLASGEWRDIPWLNPRDSVDHRNAWSWAGAGLVAAGAGLAWAQGQLLNEDGNSAHLSAPMLSGDGSQSFLRGFFAAPTLGARYAAMGGAGLAAVDDGMSLLINPAGVAAAERENLVAAKRSLPDGTPSFFLAYAGPLYRAWSQGVGVLYEGDRLASETTLHGTLACDLGAFAKALDGVKAGAQMKVYLAQVGEDGTGLDRATGHSFGMGLDLGLQARLSDKIDAAFAVRDLASFLRHSNTLTDMSYGEVLPIEYRLGASYRAAKDLLLLVDGQKGIWADQDDHLRIGGEETVFGFLALRCGLHEIFGSETVRKLSVGFGLDSDGLTDKSSKMKISLNYGYEFGLNDDEPLGGGQQFSLDASF